MQQCTHSLIKSTVTQLSLQHSTRYTRTVTHSIMMYLYHHAFSTAVPVLSFYWDALVSVPTHHCCTCTYFDSTVRPCTLSHFLPKGCSCNHTSPPISLTRMKSTLWHLYVHISHAEINVQMSHSVQSYSVLLKHMYSQTFCTCLPSVFTPSRPCQKSEPML